MRTVVSLVAVVILVGALAGCSSGGIAGPGAPAANSGSGTTSGGGSAATEGNACGIARTALSKVVTGSMSQAYKKGDTCYFGVADNAGKSGPSLAQLYNSVFHVQYTASDADSNYQAAKASYGGAKALSGVGTEAGYYDGGNGDPQVFARNGDSFCLVQTFVEDATVVGLTKTTEAGRNISGGDVPKLASEIGGVCNALFGK